MRNSPIALLIVVAVLVSGVATAQLFLQPLQVNDIKNAGTKLGIFKSAGKNMHYINFTRGGAVLNTTTKSLEINVAPVNADAGTVQALTGVQVGSIASRPTCVAALRGTVWTQFPTADMQDLTYQCCRAAAGTYSWVAVACQ